MLNLFLKIKYNLHYFKTKIILISEYNMYNLECKTNYAIGIT